MDPSGGGRREAERERERAQKERTEGYRERKSTRAAERTNKKKYIKRVRENVRVFVPGDVPLNTTIPCRTESQDVHGGASFQGLGFKSLAA